LGWYAEVKSGVLSKAKLSSDTLTGVVEKVVEQLKKAFGEHVFVDFKED